MNGSFVDFLGTAGRQERLPIRINGHHPTFRIATDKIEAQVVSPIDARLTDLLEIASAVFFADTSIRRGSDRRPGFGEAWSRHLSFCLEVREPEFWGREDVLHALRDAAAFLTGDQVTFRFVQKDEREPVQTYLPFRPDEAPFHAEEVILFSGGLDSFAGALEALNTRLANVVLVTHRSAPKAMPRQGELAHALRTRFPGRLLHIQVRATRAGDTSKETTQRSRSLLFSALGYVVARMVGARRVSFYENGVVSHNLPISPQVVGTMATRTTHPLSIRKLQQLVDLVGAEPVRIANDYRWLTKADVLHKIVENGGRECIGQTVSCFNLRRERRTAHHCGSCSQCLDRRFAILATGLQDFERADDYAVDVLFGARHSDKSRTMAFEWTRHAIRLTRESAMEFSKRFIGELTRIVNGHPEDPPTRVAEQCFDLQRRHGNSVLRVLEQIVQSRASDIVSATIEPTSLLAMIIRGGLASAPNVDDGLTTGPPPGLPAEPSEQPDTAGTSLFPLRVAFYADADGDVVEVDQLGSVRRAPARVACALKPTFEKDLTNLLAPENHRYVALSRLATMTQVPSVNTVVQNVRRCRKELAVLYEVVEGRPPDRDLLIENKRNEGYRLDPTIRLIRRDQLRSGAGG